MAQDQIIRKPLLTAASINKKVNRAEVKEIIFKPLQQTGLHLHPCPVLGYIAEGSAAFQIKGGPLQILKAGDAFFEPANTVIEHFDNASDTAPLKFIAYYLLGDDDQLIKMLPAEK
jgi:quercetin dioxygenase-like cupin family protein